MKGKISINGHIGDSYVDQNGLMHKGTNLLDVIEQVETFPQALELEIAINSPGGFVDVGDSIYDYLISQKKLGKKLTTIQTGLVGSIATKIFLAGDRRIADDRYEFWIHNPFQQDVSGDQDELRAAADAVAETEKNLIKFYGDFTSISSEGLDALMKKETGLTADQCVKFGFATEKKLVPVFNAINNTTKSINKMSKTKDEKSLKDQLLNILGVKAADPKGVQPKAKAEIPGSGEKKSLVVTLAEGAGAFWVEGDAVAVGAPAFLLDADGQPTAEPLADGDYPAEDGSMITVAGGLITAITPAAAGAGEVDNPLTAEAVAEMINAALAKAQEGSLAEIAKVKEEAKKETESKIMALKGQIKLGIQPTKGVLGGSNGQKLEYKSISQRMADQAEERKKQLNKN